MRQVSDFDGYGGRFHFEPPVEIDDNITVTSLGTIVATAAKVRLESQPMFAELYDKAVEDLIRAAATATELALPPKMIANMLQPILGDKHLITIVH